MKYLCLVTGLPGSGKTTIARQLSFELKVPLIDYDSVNEEFVNFLLRVGFSFSYSRALPLVKTMTYRTLEKLACDMFSGVRSVILAAPFTDAKDISLCPSIAELKNRMDQTLTIIDVSIVLSSETLRLRLEKRGEPRDKEKLTHWQAFLKRGYKNKNLWKVDYTFEYNNEKTPANIDALLRFLRECGL